MIPFNKPYWGGKELAYISEAVARGHISGNGYFTKRCHAFFEERGFGKCLLTTSCTDALEMAAILLNIQEGDEVIVPSFTFVSTANAFVLRGAKVVFVDSLPDQPNMDPEKIEELITSKTKAIIAVHYAGVACDMDKIMSIANKHNVFVVEDAAQAIDSFYNGKPLGTIGQLAAFSFHETKNIISGEGGLLAVNDTRFEKRSEIIWEKGTNRSAFFKGEVNKYGWVDIGSSFLPSDVIAAILLGQLELMDVIQKRRLSIWNNYFDGLSALASTGKIRLPVIPAFATNNGHMFYLVCNDGDERDKLIQFLSSQKIHTTFHYQPLQSSPFYSSKHDGRLLPNSIHYGKALLRLPFFFELKPEDQKYIVAKINEFF